MWELSADNVVDYLNRTGRLRPGSTATAQPLAWGVSNLVLRVEPDDQPPLVIKQSRPQLRTKVDWFSRCERIYREAEVLRALLPVLPPGAVPQVLFEDRENFVLALEAIRPDHAVWKQRLLEDRLDFDVADRLGGYLGLIHRETAGRPDVLPDAADWSLFDELRIDPFYRWIARVHPSIDSAINDLIEEMNRHRVCLVHADFSPKNVLVHVDGVTLVDFETGHYGDPAFDLGFFLSHLLLKSLRSNDQRVDWRRLVTAFWSRYRKIVDATGQTTVSSTATTARAVRHLAGCLLARIDGKSTVDYLRDPWQPVAVRQTTLRWLADPPPTLDHALDDFFTRTPAPGLPE
ncbi:MAG: aminoglycoside phosphotransferase family protein [Planctomycetaceae bacterium]|nr:aminoglycoside phosphotransferase family protein [Planctomycetaceae bacterium]